MMVGAGASLTLRQMACPTMSLIRQIEAVLLQPPARGGALQIRAEFARGGGVLGMRQHHSCLFDFRISIHGNLPVLPLRARGGRERQSQCDNAYIGRAAL